MPPLVEKHSHHYKSNLTLIHTNYQKGNREVKNRNYSDTPLSLSSFFPPPPPLPLLRSSDRIRYVRRTLTGDHYRQRNRDPSSRRHYSVIIHNSSPVGGANGRGQDLTASCTTNGHSLPSSPVPNGVRDIPNHLGLEQFMQRFVLLFDHAHQ